MGEADERGDQQISSLARWHLCHNILLGAEGRFFRVATILKHVRGVGSSLLLNRKLHFAAGSGLA